jgi:hypothetical protein
MRKLSLCIITLLALSSLGCITHEGQLAILLTSNADGAPAGTSQVNVTVTAVELWDNENNVWLTVAAGAQTHELVGLGSRVAPIAFLDGIERGSYTRVRMTFDDTQSNVITETGRRDPMRFDPDAVVVQSVVTVVEDASSEALFEFDLNASLNRRGNGTWLMRPVVRQVGSAR